jgi:copper transport protein
MRVSVCVCLSRPPILGVQLRTLLRSGAGIIALGIASLAAPRILSAHARLLRSSPAANDTLKTAPTSLRFWFSERPELPFTVIKLFDMSSGAPVPLGAAAAISGDSMGMTVPISSALGGGRYKVEWRTAASDGHVTAGSYQFMLSAPASALPAGTAPPNASAAQTPSVVITPGRRAKPTSNALIEPAGTTPVSTAMRWVELVALLTLIGLVVFRLAVVPAAAWDAPVIAEASDRAVRLARAVVILLIVTTLTRAFAQSDLIQGTSGRFDALLTLTRETHWGAGWALGAVGAAIALVGFLAAGMSLYGWAAAALGLVLVTASEAYTGHSGASNHLPLAIAIDVSHQLGAGGWLGGLVAVLLCGFPALRRPEGGTDAKAASQLLRAYHGSAVECVIIVVITAVVAAALRFPSVAAIWETTYGRILLLKIALVLVVLGFGLYHWRRIVLQPWTDDTAFRFKRSATVELLFGALIVAATAVLISTSLPR